MASTAVAVGGQLSLSLSLARKGSKSIAGRSAVSAAPCVVLASARLGGGSQQLPSFGVAQESKTRFSSIIVKASEQADASEQANELLKSLTESWNKVDDKLAIGGLGFAGLILLWASTGLIGALDKLPLIPDFFEFVGILFSGWFTYRYLLFKPDREELGRIIDEAKGKITGDGSVEPSTRDATSSPDRNRSRGKARSKKIVDRDPEFFAQGEFSRPTNDVGVVPFSAKDGNDVGTGASERRLGSDGDLKTSPVWEIEGAVDGEWIGFSNPGSEIVSNKPNGTARPDVSV